MKIELIAALFLGIAAAVMVARSPRLFWPVLIVANIFGNGPRLFGYFFWDEWLTGFAVIGALLCILVDKKGHANDPGNKDHKVIFIVWAFYMVAESFVGMFLNDDIRITRWILFYSLLILIFLIMHFRGDMFPFPRFRRFASITLITSVLYFLSYLAHGMMIERILGVGEFGRFAAQFETEGILWSGSATAVFPALIAMPVAIILMNDRSLKRRMLALLSVFIMMVIAF
ncbi:MAG: hypothetical protein HY954_09030 [Deltaproteobacteria bacterium]|nr:hypothetical protein [Deltaproteobacteria bacterium]